MAPSHRFPLEINGRRDQPAAPPLPCFSAPFGRRVRAGIRHRSLAANHWERQIQDERVRGNKRARANRQQRNLSIMDQRQTAAPGRQSGKKSGKR